MPDTYGEPFLSERIGADDTCQSCGGDIPMSDNLGIAIYEDSGNGWEQLCADCSPCWNGVSDALTGEDLTP